MALVLPGLNTSPSVAVVWARIMANALPHLVTSSLSRIYLKVASLSKIIGSVGSCHFAVLSSAGPGMSGVPGVDGAGAFGSVADATGDEIIVNDVDEVVDEGEAVESDVTAAISSCLWAPTCPLNTARVEASSTNPRHEIIIFSSLSLSQQHTPEKSNRSRSRSQARRTDDRKTATRGQAGRRVSEHATARRRLRDRKQHPKVEKEEKRIQLTPRRLSGSAASNTLVNS